MASKSRRRTELTRSMVATVFTLLALWMLSVYTGMRLPYIYTEFAFAVRFYILFPILFVALGYVVLVRRWPGQSDTLYALRVKHLGSAGAKRKAALLTFAGFVLLTAGFAWTSVAFPAWATQLFAVKAFAQDYRIDEIDSRGGGSWSTMFDIEMTDAEGKKLSLRLNRKLYEKNRWRARDEICVIGRTWRFGTIADDTTRDLDRCGIRRAD